MKFTIFRFSTDNLLFFNFKVHHFLYRCIAILDDTIRYDREISVSSLFRTIQKKVTIIAYYRDMYRDTYRQVDDTYRDTNDDTIRYDREFLCIVCIVYYF